ADAAWTRARNLDGLPHVRRFTRTGAKKLTRQGITALHFRGIRSSFPGLERKQYRLRGFLFWRVSFTPTRMPSRSKSGQAIVRKRSRKRETAELPEIACSGGPHRGEELAHLGLEPTAVAGQHLRRREHLRGGRSGIAGAALHIGDVSGHLLG